MTFLPDDIPHLDSMTLVPEAQAWEAFRLASMGGGSPPDWTMQGSEPRYWHPPHDAAGALLVRDTVAYRGIFGLDQSGLEIYRSYPEPPKQWYIDRAWAALQGGSGELDRTVWRLHAAYYSCGGRGVFLFTACDCWYVYVGRKYIPPEERTGSLGCSEQNIAREIPEAEIYRLDDGYASTLMTWDEESRTWSEAVFDAAPE